MGVRQMRDEQQHHAYRGELEWPVHEEQAGDREEEQWQARALEENDCEIQQAIADDLRQRRELLLLPRNKEIVIRGLEHRRHRAARRRAIYREPDLVEREIIFAVQ